MIKLKSVDHHFSPLQHALLHASLLQFCYISIFIELPHLRYTATMLQSAITGSYCSCCCCHRCRSCFLCCRVTAATAAVHRYCSNVNRIFGLQVQQQQQCQQQQQQKEQQLQQQRLRWVLILGALGQTMKTQLQQR